MLLQAEAMKLEYQSRWLRVLLEILPVSPAIRRYRALPPPLEAPTGRLLRRKILRRLRQPEPRTT